MTEKLDAGPILLQKKVSVDPDDNTEILGSRLANAGAHLLLETLDLLKANDLQPIPQGDREATLAPSLKKEDGKIDFSKKARLVLNLIQGVTPWPGATTTLEDHLLKIHKAEVVPHKKKGTPGDVLVVGPLGIEVACGQDALLLQEVQLEGKKRMPASEFLKGHPIRAGTKFG